MSTDQPTNTVSIGRLDAATGTVTATFTLADGRIWQRRVAACFDSEGRHNRVATRARAESMLPGVLRKAANGLIEPASA